MTARLELPRAEVAALCKALGSPRQAFNVVALRLAEEAGWLARGECARLARSSWREVAAASRELERRSGGTLQADPLPASVASAGERLSLAFFEGAGADPLALSGAAELIFAAPLARGPRRALGAFYTPPDLAALVVELALLHGDVAAHQLPSVVDPCIGAGAFVAAAARALRSRAGRPAAALACGGADKSALACTAAKAALALEAGPEASAAALAALGIRVADSLLSGPGVLADLLVSNPPYGHLEDPAERAAIAELHPALRGGELDRYAAFLLRALQLVRPGGTAALLIPDSWMTNSRGAGLRAAVLDAAELAAVVDLGKPFAAAKDTRVQAVVLVRRAGSNRNERSSINAGRRSGAAVEALAPLEPQALRASVKVGWQPYRTAGERELCAAMDAASVPLGSVCVVGYGLRTGDNGRHVRRGALPEGGVPLLGGEDIVPFGLRYKPKHLPAESAALLARLVGRQLGSPRVAIQRIRTNSGQSFARWLEAALCPPERVCLDSITTLAWPGDEERLSALLGLVCSTAMNRYHRLRTTDVNVKPSLLKSLPLPRKLLEPGGARLLAGLSRARAAEVAASVEEAAPAPALERSIDAAVYELFSLSKEQIDAAERGHWADRFATERPRLEALLPGVAGVDTPHKRRPAGP